MPSRRSIRSAGFRAPVRASDDRQTVMLAIIGALAIAGIAALVEIAMRGV